MSAWSGRRSAAAALAAIVVAAGAVVAAGCGDDDRTTLARGLVSIDGHRVAVHDNCHDGARLDVDEGDDRVVLTFSVAAETGGDCFGCIVAALEAPVGDRTLVDGATGETMQRDDACFTVEVG